MDNKFNICGEYQTKQCRDISKYALLFTINDITSTTVTSFALKLISRNVANSSTSIKETDILFRCENSQISYCTSNSQHQLSLVKYDNKCELYVKTSLIYDAVYVMPYFLSYQANTTFYKYAEFNVSALPDGYTSIDAVYPEKWISTLVVKGNSPEINFFNTDPNYLGKNFKIKLVNAELQVIKKSGETGTEKILCAFNYDNETTTLLTPNVIIYGSSPSFFLQNNASGTGHKFGFINIDGHYKLQSIYSSNTLDWLDLDYANKIFNFAYEICLNTILSPPPPKAGGIYFDGTNFKVCKDGVNWVILI